jgi:hypothetical protein
MLCMVLYIFVTYIYANMRILFFTLITTHFDISFGYENLQIVQLMFKNWPHCTYKLQVYIRV